MQTADQKKKLVKSNKSISRKIFLNIIRIEKGKYTKKKFCEIDSFYLTSFLAWTFLNFLAHCACIAPIHYFALCPTGYGGEDTFSSEDEDEVDVLSASKKFEAKENDSSANEMTTEEKNMLNMTRQNTSFNSRPHNLNPEAPRLGVDKKVTPLITVRPFGHRNDTNTSTPINKVSPMKNGELVEAKNNMAITLNSDGASTESSSSEEEISRPTSGLERQFLKAKQSAATARLSFLNSTITEANKG